MRIYTQYREITNKLQIIQVGWMNTSKVTKQWNEWNKKIMKKKNTLNISYELISFDIFHRSLKNPDFA